MTGSQKRTLLIWIRASKHHLIVRSSVQYFCDKGGKKAQVLFFFKPGRGHTHWTLFKVDWLRGVQKYEVGVCVSVHAVTHPFYWVTIPVVLQEVLPSGWNPDRHLLCRRPHFQFCCVEERIAVINCSVSSCLHTHCFICSHTHVATCKRFYFCSLLLIYTLCGLWHRGSSSGSKLPYPTCGVSSTESGLCTVSGWV